MTDDRPYVERQGGSYVREKNGKEKRVAGTAERDGPEPRAIPAATEPQPASPPADPSKKGK